MKMSLLPLAKSLLKSKPPAAAGLGVGLLFIQFGIPGEGNCPPIPIPIPPPIFIAPAPPICCCICIAAYVLIDANFYIDFNIHVPFPFYFPIHIEEDIHVHTNIKICIDSTVVPDIDIEASFNNSIHIHKDFNVNVKSLYHY